MTALRIRRWAIPSPKRLEVNIHPEGWMFGAPFCRTEASSRPGWCWKSILSDGALGRDSVSALESAELTRLVRAHPVLSRLLDQFGLEEGT